MSEVLVVASKVKKMIKDKSGMNTSASVMDALTKLIERECLKAIERAGEDNRKTVMDRDFTP
jgi:histone H3/H4